MSEEWVAEIWQTRTGWWARYRNGAVVVKAEGWEHAMTRKRIMRKVQRRLYAFNGPTSVEVVRMSERA